MSRDRMVHELKCWPPYFRQLADGSKQFEESLRKAIASDLRSMGRCHPELAAWAETLACRYARGEEAT